MVFHVHEFCVISQIYGTFLWPKETTEIDARDVLTEQTLLEYVCTSELIDRGCSGLLLLSCLCVVAVPQLVFLPCAFYLLPLLLLRLLLLLLLLAASTTATTTATTTAAAPEPEPGSTSKRQHHQHCCCTVNLLAVISTVSS